MARGKIKNDRARGDLMQSTTATYLPYADERRVSAQAVYELISVTAADDATATASSEGPLSKLQQTHDKQVTMTHALVTNEPDSWVLDGKMKLPNATDNGEAGWWGANMSDADGILSETLTATFTSDQSSKGFTIVFDDKSEEYATDFTLTTYDANDVVISTMHITDNTSSVCVIDLSSDNYRKVILSFNKTSNPYRYVRVCELVFGFLQYFKGNDIYSLEITHEIDPTMQTLPAGKLVLTLNNLDRQYNILNPSGVYRFLQKGQGMNTQIGIGDDNINTGRFYFAESKSSNGALTASVTAYDKIWALDKTKCNIGMTETWTVAAAVAAVLTNSGLDITTVIPSAIGARTINKCIPKDTTHREAIRMIAQAGKCACYIDRIDRLVFFEPAIGTAVDNLDGGRMEDWPEITDTGLVNTVVITSRDEYADTENTYTATNIQPDEEPKTLEIDNPLASGNDAAEWLLSMVSMRYAYSVKDRGNPAREIGDSIQINDAYSENATAVLVAQKLEFDGGLESDIRAVKS